MSERHTSQKTPPVSGTGLIGRAQELGQLSETFGASTGVVLVEGEAGVGKTRLVREFLDTNDARALLAQCPPLPEPFPLGPLIDALRRVDRDRIGGMDLTELAGALRPLFPEWAALLPPAPEPMDDARAVQHRLFRGLDELLSGLAVEILVIEDVHWADQATLEFLLYRWSQSTHAGVLVLTYRLEDVPEASLLWRVGACAAGGVNPVRISLPPLTVNQVRELVSHMLDTESVSSEFATFLHRHTAGIPLAVEETVNLLRDRADIVRREDVWVRRTLEHLVVPGTVRDSVLERAGRLSRAGQRILGAAAALDRPAMVKTLRAVAGLNATQARAGLESALTSGLLREVEPGDYQLRHALASRAIYESLTSSARVLAHQRAVHALEKLDPPPVAELARHCKHAGDTKRWARYAELGADLAVATGDEGAAVVLLHDILSNVEMPVGNRGRLGVKLAEAAVRSGGTLVVRKRIDDIIRRLRELLDGSGLPRTDRGKTRLFLGLLLTYYGDPRKGRAEIEQSVADLAELPALAARAMIILCYPWIDQQRPVDSLDWLEQALALMPQIRLRADRIALAVDCAVNQLTLGDAAGWQTADHLPVDAETLEEKRQLARGYANLAYVALVWGRSDRCQAWLELADPLIGSTPFLGIQNRVRLHRAWLSYRTGQWSGLKTEVARLASSDLLPVDRIEAGILEGLMLLAEGEVQVGKQCLLGALDKYQGSTQEDISLIASAALGRLELAENHPEAALERTQDAIAKVTATALWLWAVDIAPVHVAAMIQAGALAPAAAWVDTFAQGVRALDAQAPTAALIVCQALIAEAEQDYHQAAELFTRAAHTWAGLPRPYEQQLALEGRALNMIQAGELAPALELLKQTESRLSALGARWDADRIAQRLRKHNIAVKRNWQHGRKSYGTRLSPREIEVVRLIAEGLTNKQIANKLFLSPKTITNHATSAMRKLDVRSRTALALTAAQRGLLE